MNERMMQFRVGVMVLATLLITGILVALINEPRALMPGASYTVHIRFRQAPNVTQHTPIRKSGILIGRVGNVRLLDDGGVLVTTELDGDKRLRHNEIFRIVNDLFGDAVINVVPSDDLNAADTFVRDGEQLNGVVVPSPGQVIQDLDERLDGVMVTVTEAGNALTRAGEDLSKAACNVNSLLDANGQQITDAIAQAKETLAAVEKVADGTSEVFGDEQTRLRLRRSIDGLPDTLDSMGRTIEKAEFVLRRFVDPSEQTGESRIDQIFRTMDSVDKAMGHVAVFSEEMETFSRNLNSEDGSLGRFIHDPELYTHLNRAAKRIDDVSWRLEPIVDDVRVFTDKIARHPEMLGVRGALERRAGVK
ncbi:MAG: MCE family protein [Pirellulales bacterium]|nr:MCE family protein [Pirellulales bacterium]